MRSDEEEVHELLRHLDHPMPRVDVRDVMQRARPMRWSRVGRAAAVFVMLGAAGVAWAIPGSGFSSFIVKLVARMTQGSNIDNVAPAPAVERVATPSVSPPAMPRLAGIAVPPGSQLIVSFAASQNDGELRVSLADVPDVSVRTEVGAATFTSSDGRLVIANAGSEASFTIELPVGAPRVEIVVNGRRRFLKNGARITAATAARLGELYVIPLKPLPGNRP